MAGDTLARGARSAKFGPARVSQEKWDSIWAEEPKKETAKETSKVQGEVSGESA